jgi:hypothetical protein
MLEIFRDKTSSIKFQTIGEIMLPIQNWARKFLSLTLDKSGFQNTLKSATDQLLVELRRGIAS